MPDIPEALDFVAGSLVLPARTPRELSASTSLAESVCLVGQSKLSPSLPTRIDFRGERQIMAEQLKLKIYEEDVRQSLIDYLRSQGIKDIETEVCLGAGWSFVDIVYIDERRRFVCIEVKLRDWKKVLEQARKLLQWTPLVYIAMPAPATYYRKMQIEGAAGAEQIGVWWLRDNKVWQKKSVQAEERLFDKKNTFTYFNLDIQDSFYNCLNFTFLAKCVKYKWKRKRK